MYNRFAKMRHRYLREHRNGIYTGMFLDGKLEEHLKEIGEAAEEMEQTIVKAMEFYNKYLERQRNDRDAR